MTTNCLRKLAKIVGTSTFAAVLGGCCGSQLRSDQIATTSVAVVNVVPFASIKESLKPKFTISGDTAKAEAIGITASQQTRSLNAVIGEVDAGIDVGSTGSVPASPANQPMATAAPASVAASTLVTDASTVYSAADSLNQDVQMRNQAMDWVAGLDDDKFTAYVVRMSVSVLPITRDQPFDVLADMSFFPAGSVAATDQVKVIPLLVTESFESIAEQQTNETLRSLAIALSAQIGQAKVGGSLKAINDYIADLQARQLNGLLNVARIGTNSLRVRLGASASVRKGDTEGLGYRMIPRDHKVSVLIIVPKDTPELQLTSSLQYVSTDSKKPVYAGSVSRRDAVNSTRALFKNRLKPDAFKALDEMGVKSDDSCTSKLNRWGEILAAREHGDVARFVRLANNLDDAKSPAAETVLKNGTILGFDKINQPFSVRLQTQVAPDNNGKKDDSVALSGSTDAGGIWNEMTQIIARQSVQSEPILLKANAPVANDSWKSASTPALLDNGTTATVKIESIGMHLDAANIRASVALAPPGTNINITIPANSISTGDHDSSLSVVFPSLQPIIDALKANTKTGSTTAPTFDPGTPKLTLAFIDPTAEWTTGSFPQNIDLSYIPTKSPKDAEKAAASLSFSLNAVVRSRDGSNPPIDFTIVPTKNNPDAPKDGVQLLLKISGVSSAGVAGLTTATNPTPFAGQNSSFIVTPDTTYRATLNGTDLRTPVTFQVLKKGNDPNWKDATPIVSTDLPVISH